MNMIPAMTQCPCKRQYSCSKRNLFNILRPFPSYKEPFWFTNCSLSYSIFSFRSRVPARYGTFIQKRQYSFWCILVFFQNIQSSFNGTVLLWENTFTTQHSCQKVQYSIHNVAWTGTAFLARRAFCLQTEIFLQGLEGSTTFLQVSSLPAKNYMF